MVENGGRYFTFFPKNLPRRGQGNHEGLLLLEAGRVNGIDMDDVNLLLIRRGYGLFIMACKSWSGLRS